VIADMHDSEKERSGSASSFLGYKNQVYKDESLKRPKNRFLPGSKYLLEYNEPALFDIHYIFLGTTTRNYEQLFKIIDHFDDKNLPPN
jgi:hypothetical protein